MEILKKKIQKAVNKFKSGDLLEAEKLSKALIESNPKIVFLYNLLGLISVDLKKIDKALNYYEEGIKIDDTDANLYNNIGVLLFNYKYESNTKQIEFNYKKSILLNDNNPEAYNNLGNFYKSLNKIEDAINNYKKSSDLNPKFYFALFNLASLYVSCGKINEAKKELLKVLDLAPNYILAHRLLNRITIYSNESEHLKTLNKLHKQIDDNDDNNKMLLSFSLGKAFEDTKSFDKSFAFYKEANAISRKNITFSTKSEKLKFNKIKKFFTSNIFNKYKNLGYNDFSPIFIVGMPRSGTTLVEQILSSHPNVYGCDEIEFIPEIISKNSKILDLLFSKPSSPSDLKENEFKKMGKDYIYKINKLSNFSKRTTDKLPTNFLSIGFIKLILPKSKIVHCYRNPKDNCMSIYKNYFSSGKLKFSSDLIEIVEYYNLYKDLMNFWKDTIPDFIYDIKYEHIVDETELQVKKLLKNCELKWNDNCLNFDQNKRQIKTASDVQARKKIYKTSVESWKNYESFVSDIFLNLNIN